MPEATLVGIGRAARRRIATWFALMLAHRTSRQRLRHRRPRRLLVLCYGNIYRSAFVAAALQNTPTPFLSVRSAGFHPRPNRATPDKFVTIAADYGVALQEHRSSVVDRQAVAWADTIVIMDRHNWSALHALDAEAVGKAIWLGVFAPGGGVEIQDPYGASEDLMRTIAERLHGGVCALRGALQVAAER